VILVPYERATLMPPFRDRARIPGSSVFHAACEVAGQAAAEAIEQSWQAYRREIITLKREGLTQPAPPSTARLHPRDFDPRQLPWFRLSGVARPD